MAARGGIITFLYTGAQGRDDIPSNITHVIIHESVTVIPVRLFFKHPNIIEVYCHAGVKKIEQRAFAFCPRLKRVVMLGVEVVDERAFLNCQALTYIECPKLEKIGLYAFGLCLSLRFIDLPSIKIVGAEAFFCIKIGKFGKNLESIREKALCCPSLEEITIPLKGSLMIDDDAFVGSENLNRVDLLEGRLLQDCIDALLCDDWSNDMNQEVDSINQILPNTFAGKITFESDDIDAHYHCDAGFKAIVIRDWIKRVLDKIIRYKARHRYHLKEAATSLQPALPVDIVMNSVIPFLELPPHMFDGEEEE